MFFNDKAGATEITNGTPFQSNGLFLPEERQMVFSYKVGNSGAHFESAPETGPRQIGCMVIC